MTRFSYLVYGLSLESNQPIAGLPQVPVSANPSVQIDIVGQVNAPFADPPDTLLLNGVKSDGAQSHSLKVWDIGGTVHVRYALQDEQIDFAIASSGDAVRVCWTMGFPVDDMHAFLLGPVIGCILRLRGVLALHAGAVAVGDGAIAITGDKGAGKSTLMAAFAKAGYPILSDDVAPIRFQSGHPIVAPGYPRLRLWPATLEGLGIAYEALPRVESIFDKRYFDLSTDLDATTWLFCAVPRRLIAVYHLSPRSNDAPAEISPLQGPAALDMLLRNCYVDYILDQNARIAQFRALGQLEKGVRLRSVQRPDDLDQLERTCDALVQDAMRVSGTS